ncbi:NUDIX hydrolase [Fusibacter ferrireducens]|uniref:NUDIX hydrolase n=1 Tax=Fusibacter ferrireducens TaxID=2785058 RepID=A0ABR9ZU22_9FIRM|nr:NUDIX hydrolase [Fusibacter ferrireducens]MBF4693959.1 NUDIX hydrolase [Fusibacter ferrireducens]
MLNIEKYLKIMNDYPEFYVESENLKIIKDESIIIEYQIKNKIDLGIIYENEYFFIINDLVENRAQIRFPYFRLINKAGYNGVAIIPMYENKFVLLKHFRHGTRNVEYEIPRGFSEIGLSIENNAKKEIFEELGSKVADIQSLGSVISDSGLSGGEVFTFLCSLESIGKINEIEGIESYVLKTKGELKDMINKNIIRDAFSLSVICKLFCRED